jgi:hypothetical protein
MKKLVLALALAASVQAEELRFLPPDPDSHAAVTARIFGIWPDSTYPRCGSAAVSGQTITIALGCVPQGGFPAIFPWSLDVFAGAIPAGVYNVRAVLGERMLAERRLIVQDADARFTVHPNVYNPLSGSRVILKGEALRDWTSATPLSIRFGDQFAGISAMRDDEWEVTPPPGSGTVDITIEGQQNLHRKAAFHYPEAGTPEPAFFTPILFPLFLSANGAFGSLWDTDVSVRNDNPYTFTSPYGSLFELWCLLCDPPPPPGVRPHQSATIRAGASLTGVPSGFLSWVPRQAAKNVHFGLLVRDLSRQREALGAEVPVVREHEFFDGTSFSLLNIPADPRFRTALRVYAIDGATQVRLRILPMSSPQVLVDTSVVVPKAGGQDQNHGALFIGDLVAAYPQLAGHGPLRIEVEPLSPGAIRIWGFASITNNETQHVTVISPQ